MMLDWTKRMLKLLIARRALFAILCTICILLPQQSSAGPQKHDNRLICKASSKKPQTKKQDRRATNTPQPSRRQPQQPTKPQQPQRPKTPPKPVTRSPQKAVSELLDHVAHSEKYNRSEKQALTESIQLLSQTPCGKWLLQNLPENIHFGFVRGLDHVAGQQRGGSIRINEDYFSDYAQAKTSIEKQDVLYSVVSVMAHEMTHACQDNLSMFPKNNVSTIDYTILSKMEELHAAVVSAEVRDQLLDLPAFRELRVRKPELLQNLFRKVIDKKRQNGSSFESATRFARTEITKSWWQNTPSTPIRVGNDLIFASDSINEGWNRSYNLYVFDNVIHHGEKYWTDHGHSIDGILRRDASLMGVDISPEFFKQQRSFQYDRGRLIGYMDGIRNLEVDYLSGSSVQKFYQDGRLWMTTFPKPQTKDGQYKECWYGTSHVRATYTVHDKQIVGLYREYDYAGNQVAEIPFQKGAPNGMGWVIQNGQKIPKRFANGICYDVNERVHTWNKGEDYWRQRYLNFQSTGRYTP